MKKALVYASVASMIQQFNMNNIRLLQEQGYQVDVACNMENGGSITQEKVMALRSELETMGVRVFHIPITRSIAEVSDMIRSVRDTKKLISDNQYALIHCHSPIGGVVCRLANRLVKGFANRKMIYTAHGFHFYKGAPLLGWMMFYPIEKICSFFTDTLITINQEDYVFAKKKMNAKNICYVPGVGIDVKKIGEEKIDPGVKKQELGLPENSFLLFSIGELNKNKNHEVIIHAMKTLDKNIYYLIAGKGDLAEHLMDCAKRCGVEDRVKLLGYRSDIAQLLNTADLFVFPSFREGLPVSVMEAMAAGKAIVCSRIRGNTDLVEDGAGGFLVDADNVDGFSKLISMLYKETETRNKMGEHNMKKIQLFSSDKIDNLMSEIYRDAVK